MESKNRCIAYVGPGEGRSLWVLGELVTWKVTSAQTGGAYSLFEILSQPGGGPSPHIQHREDESFYVIEGQYEFLDEGRVMRVNAGSLLYVPRGNLHAYRNVGAGTGRMLVSQTPGGLHEHFFEELGKSEADGSRPAASGEQTDAERVTEIAAKYGIEITTSLAQPGDRKESQ